MSYVSHIFARLGRLAGTACLALIGVSAGAESLQSTMRFEHLGIEEGLSQSAVMDIVQDSDGFIWFATESGLDRYDGYGVVNYRHERGNDASLGSNFVRDLAIGHDGGVWAATDGGGVSYWDPASDTFTTLRHDPANPMSIASDRIRRIETDAAGYVWIATRESGLDRLHVASGQVHHFRKGDAQDTLGSDEVYAVAIGADGATWVGTRTGLSRIAAGEDAVERIDAPPLRSAGLQGVHIRSLLVDSSGDLWVGTNQDGLFLLRAGEDRVETFRHLPEDTNSLPSNRIEALFEDSDKRLWVGTDRGLSLLDRDHGHFHRFTNDPSDITSLSDNFVFSLYQDRGGLLWVGTRTGGANKWNPRSWSFGHFNPREDRDNALSNPSVTSFAVDAAGRNWIGTFGGGINIFSPDGNKIAVIRHRPEAPGSLTDDRVMALLRTRDGAIWAGTMRGGLNRIDPQTLQVTSFRHRPADAQSLAADGIMSLYEDRRGRLWIGTFGGGVSRYRPLNGDFVNFANQAGDAATLSSNRATSIAEDAYGAIWVGTDGGGLNRSVDDGRTWQRLTHDNDAAGTLSANTVYALYAAMDGTLWVGTRSGIDRILLSDSGAILSVRNANEDFDIGQFTIYSMVPDKRGDLWMGTERGLLALNKESGTTRLFHSEHGLQADEFNFGAAHAAPSGEIFVGGANGFNRFDPDALRFGDNAGRIVVTAFDIWNEPVETSTPYHRLSGIDLDHGDDSVSLEFASLDFEAPERIRYAYRLVGFDENWVDAGADRRVVYTNLAGGDYELQVRSALATSDWSDIKLRLPIHVAAAPWETWWAYASYVFLSFCLLYFLFSRQNQKLKRESEIARRLEKEVRERTRELDARNRDLSVANDKLTTLSTTDALTGLRNRRYLFEKVSKDVDLVLRRKKDILRGADTGDNTDLLFLMVDLDNFKPVNDTLGHQAGDELLLQIRDVLVDSCRASDDIIRWGGDEFLIVARDTDPVFAASLAERIRANLAQRVFDLGDDQTARSTASIGYATYPFIRRQPDLLLWEDVLGIADTAMYAAKTKRNAWVGIEGLNWDGDGQSLYAAIRDDADALARKSRIRWVTSVREAEVGYG